VPYIGQDLQVAFPSYTNIDDISGSFDGVTTSFPLTVGGVAPVPAPLGSNQCLISVDGVVQRPDDTGTEGFRLSGGNIIFSSAPSIADDFFGIILAGADYVNVGANFPDGTLAAPSITFDQDNDTGYYRSGSGSVSFASNGVAAGTWSSAGVTAPAFIPTGSSVPTNGVYLPAANSVGVATNGSGRLFIDANGKVEVSTATGSSSITPTELRISSTTDANDWNTTNPWARLGFYSADTTNGARTRAAIDVVQQFSNGNVSAFSFKTDNGSGTLVERQRIAYTGTTTLTSAAATEPFIVKIDASEVARIDSSGRLGIGTSAPNVPLEVVGNIHMSGAADRTIFNRANNALSLGTNNTTRLHITNAGNVGIGDTGPDSTLTVTGGAIRSKNVSGDTGFDFHENGSAALIRQRNNRPLLFYTNNAEVARLDTSGRLLVGTSSASASFSTLLQNASGDSFGILGLAANTATPADNSPLGDIRWSDSGHTLAAIIRCRRDGGTWSGSSKPTRLEFSTTADGASSPTERMRIANTGQLNVFSSAAVLVPRTAASAGTSTSLLTGRHSATVNDTGGTISVHIWSNGDVVNTNNSYGAISDIKLKENIVDASSQWADIKALQVRKYNFKEGQTHTQIGLVAQEVELVSPGLVSESPDRDEDGNDLGTVTKSVNYSVLYMKAVKALQEAMERIETLEARLTAAGIE
jgi:hypothetical protein